MQFPISRLSVVIARGFLVTYPFLIYFGLTYFKPRYLGLVFILIILAQTVHSKTYIKNKASFLTIPIAAVGAICAVLVSTSNNDLYLRLYPFMINISFLLVFSVSLVKPPSVIERIARIKRPKLSEHALRYIHNLMMVWCGFFVINGAISLYTALFSSIEIWTLYNGLIAYLVIGAIFFVDIVIRIVKKMNP